MKMTTVEKMTEFCRQYGFIYPGSEIYGGLAKTWDYGPLGAMLKENFKKAWRKRFIQERFNTYEVDASILMHPKVWEASGHVESFSISRIDCRQCKTQFNAENFISYATKGKVENTNMNYSELLDFIRNNEIKCPNCGCTHFKGIRDFNQMFEVRGNEKIMYLRPETAQGEYVNFLNVQRTTRAKLPFSIAQVGKAFRNEIAEGNFTFRSLEFEQMELQTFCKPGSDIEQYEYFKEYAKKFYTDLGLSEKNLRFHNHETLAHYAKEACDIEYNFPFGWGELNGTHNRGDYDLSRHQEYSGKSMKYLDRETHEHYIPYVVESTVGVDRSILAILFEAYNEEELPNGKTRVVMKFHPYLAPYKVAVLPLVKKYHSEKAMEIYKELSKDFMVTYDDNGNLGKRYKRSDIYGIPFDIAVDDKTLEDNTVVVRERDSMKQITLKVHELANYISERVKF